MKRWKRVMLWIAVALAYILGSVIVYDLIESGFQ